ncbi:MAG: arsenate reductase ArsC [Anaerolineae bacterium]
MPLKRVLVICTGNTSRSQLAEGMINHFLAGRWLAFSGGSHFSGYVHPLALSALRELGIDASGQTSKGLDQFIGQPFDAVITVCDNAAKYCPFWPGQGKVIHMPLPDPGDVEGTPEERLAAFREVRELIRSELFPILEADE